MKFEKIVFLMITISICTVLITTQLQTQDSISVLVNNSGPYIGTAIPHDYGFDGSGIIISVIDTGVDFNHPDLLGLGLEGKIIGGYDFVDNDETPEDSNGHGTQVTGIIASNGNLKGIAPNSKILAYRVSEDGESVSSDLIIKAIEKSINDNADIINISLGVNQTNTKIDQIVTKAIQNNIFVVTAAGNFGPEPNTIGSPGLNPNTITVGSTFNNVSSSLVSTFKIEDQQFNIFPMVGTQPLEEPITAQIIFGEYGRAQDLSDIDVEGSILLVERGGDMEDEIVFFSDKERNSADSGAKAIVVYNSEPGIFFGELIHEFVDEDYNPAIPALSMSREDGLVIKQMLQSHTEGTLDVFYHPDFVAFFSSRGPVSPFYMKPDIVAPGAFINTTNSGGNYKIVSGTSFAAPHIAGTAALILQKNPQLTPNELKSILMTTSDIISNEYDERFPVEVAGSGRINVAKAIDSELIIIPPNLIFNLSDYNQIQTKDLEIMGIDNKPVSIRFENNQVADFDYDLKRENLTITAKLSQQGIKYNWGEFESRMIISYNDVEYNIPIIVRINEATILVNEDDGVLSFDVFGHPSWSYAKISVTNKETGETFTESITPTKKSELTVYQPGEYWIEANIKKIDGLSSKTLNVYETIKIEKAEENQSFVNTLNLPEKPLLIITAVMIITVVVGIFIRKY
uniref:Peptidase S8 and S53 subtilisin kexin sedolisin (Vpr) n=2 Tax=environmental samples TaxID=651140 RepID=A0A075I1Y9_9ARCH|nr:Peptidase S8 and S53 subtilisin kexin sedolisin (vpr) [uncultured marine thaumarchaeote KM3_95_D02]